ncbi:unnamed protein product [Rotaria socialis]
MDTENPNHLIIWLDKHIEDPEWCQQMKKAFSTQTDPKNPIPVKLSGNDNDSLFNIASHMPVHFEGVRFLLAAHKNIESCLQCFEQNQDKRIFFITSGSLGREAAPIILERFLHMFTDLVTGKPYISIYVFCHHIQYHLEWALDYRDYIQIFNFDADLLVRMMRDIGDYYYNESRRLLDTTLPNKPAAYNRLIWARTLYERYGELERKSMHTELGEINKLLEQVEEELRLSSDVDS